MLRLGATVAALAAVGRVPFAAGARLGGKPASVSGSGESTRAAFRSIVASGSRTLYVSGSGKDTNPGTQAAPFREINRAVATALPGDLILVDSGTYEPVYLTGFAGSSTAWLAIMTLSDSTQATCLAPSGNAISVNGSSFVGIYGLEVVGNQQSANPNGSGICIYGNSHHVLVWKTIVHDFPGGGINCFDVDDQWGFGSHDMLDLSFNTIFNTSRYSPSATSGISLYASRDLTGGQTWDGRYANRIVGNYIYGVENLVPYSVAGYSYITDGNAVSIDSLKTVHGYTKPVLIEGNLLVGCGGRGVHVFNSINVDGAGNTGIGNLRTVSPAMVGGCEFDGTTDASVRWHGNVILPRSVPNWHDWKSSYDANVVLGGTQSVSPSNIDHQAMGYAYFPGGPSDQGLLNGTNVSAFAPSVADLVAALPYTTGWQTLGVGRRPSGSWAAGSLQPSHV